MIWLIFAHFIGETALQSDWQAQNKGRLWYAMLSHCIVWTACICIMMKWNGLIIYTWHWVFLLIGHWISDKWKVQFPKTTEYWKAIYLDQIWHLIQCFIVYFFNQKI